MRYYKIIRENKSPIIGTGYDGIEITEEEYNSILKERQEKSELIDKLVMNLITEEEIKPKWREEIVSQAKLIKQLDRYASSDEAELSDNEAIKIILGGEV